MNTSTKEKQPHRHREQTCGCRGVGGREGLGVWGQQMQTTVYSMDKQEGPTAQHRELYSIPCDKDYSAIKRNEIELFVATWMDLEIIILSEVSQRKISYNITYMWNLKK